MTETSGRRRAVLVVAGVVATLAVLGVAGCVFVLLRYTSYEVTGISMQPAIERGDHLWLQSVDVDEIARGDVVVLRPPDVGDAGQLVVSRVVAVGGERVSGRGGRLIVDGVRAAEPYASGPTRDFAPVSVPAGRVFVLGDNRQNTVGSDRYGPVPLSSVTGKVARSGVPSGAVVLVAAVVFAAVAVVAGLVGRRATRPPSRRKPVPAAPEPAPGRFFD